MDKWLKLTIWIVFILAISLVSFLITLSNAPPSKKVVADLAHAEKDELNEIGFVETEWNTCHPDNYAYFDDQYIYIVKLDRFKHKSCRDDIIKISAQQPILEADLPTVKQIESFIKEYTLLSKHKVIYNHSGTDEKEAWFFKVQDDRSDKRIVFIEEKNLDNIIFHKNVDLIVDF
ncbi:hypothetical protein [Longirhabdus pacifica]|uniref:hypothetical protein n=1 Tax=Longirhabdus pacifica TaxID=2305227 RepID=UPI00100877F2|nr:hypothetical protein [Longirhabdus pacifica]